MSKDVNAPSSPKYQFRPHSRSGLFRKPPSQNQPVSAAFEPQTTRRPVHGRAASFGGIVSRMLPSRRQEKGHTIRSAFQDDGLNNAVDLVFGLADSPNLAVCEPLYSGRTEKARSVFPRKDGNLQAETVNDDIWRSHTSAVRDGVEVEVRKSRPRSLSFNWLLGTKGAPGNGINEKPRMVSTEVERDEMSHLRKPSGPPVLPLELPKMIPFRKIIAAQEVETNRAKQIFEQKKISREQRRSLQESGDFLGVQGANPRTGMWDISDNTTSSSDPSQVGTDVKAVKVKHEDSQAKHWAKLQRIHDLKDEKKKAKAERKTLDGKKKQKRRGKWMISDNGWSSVAEPTLSPIEQSLAGSPVREVPPPPPDRLLPMPCAADIAKDSFGYFGLRTVSSPLAQFHAAGEAILTPAKSNYAIRRKPVGSAPSRGQGSGSTETILRARSNSMEVGNIATQPPSSPARDQSKAPKRENKVPGEFPCPLDSTETPSKNPHPFLGSENVPTIKSRSPYERLATAISYRSVTTNQVKIREPRSRHASYQGRIISSLSELPPISLRDPILARVPLSSQRSHPSKSQAQAWASPAIIDTATVSSTNISTTTTTGFTPQRRLPAQLDGTDDYDDSRTRLKIPVKHPNLRHKLSFIPPGSNPLPNNRQSNRLRSMSLIRKADNATFSEHQLHQTKHRTGRLCRKDAPELGRARQKGTPISISTFPRSPSRQTVFAHNAALQAFQNLQEQTARETSRRYSIGTLTPQRVRMRTTNARREVNIIRDNEEVNTRCPRTSLITGGGDERGMHLVRARTGEFLDIRAGSTALSRTEPDVEKHKMVGVVGKNARAFSDKNGVALSKNAPRSHVTIGAVVRVLRPAGWIVGQVMDPKSDSWQQWTHYRCTWKAVGIFTAVGGFALAIFLVAMAFARGLGICFQAIKACVELFTS